MAQRTKTVGLAVGTLAVLQLMQDVDFVHQHLPSWSLSNVSRSTVSLGLIAGFILLLRFQANESADDSTNSNTNTNNNNMTANPTQKIEQHFHSGSHESNTPRPPAVVKPKHNVQYAGYKLLPENDWHPTVLVAYFKNVPIDSETEVGPFVNAQAAITYTHDKGSTPEVSEIQPAKWMEQPEPRITIAVTFTKAVIVAVWNGETWNSRRQVVSRMSRHGGYASQDESLPFGVVSADIVLADRTTAIEAVNLILTLRKDATATVIEL
jgi:hypothetical protein